MKILVLKEVDLETRRSLRGLKFYSLSLLEFKNLKFRLPQSEYDYLILSSKQTLKALKDLPQTRNILAIGKATQSAARRKWKREILRLRESHSQGLLRYFSRSSRKLRLFFPRSSLGDPGIIRALRRQGHQVLVRHAYETRGRNLKGSEVKLLRSQAFDAVWAFSPSGLRHLRRAYGLRRICTRLWVCVGPTTAKQARAYGLKVVVSPKPEIPEILKVTRMSLRAIEA